MFSVDDVVWAKSALAREIFWPAQVVEPDYELHKKPRKKPVVAFVNFLNENTYEPITNSSHVQAFNCEKKDAFLKKGRSLKDHAKKLSFENAVKEAQTYIKLRGKRKRTTPSKLSFDVKATRSLPRTRKSELLGEEKQFSNSKNATSILNECERKSRTIETCEDNLANNTSVSSNKKRSGIRKTKDKINKFKTIEKANKLNLRKNRNDCVVEHENELATCNSNEGHADESGTKSRKGTLVVSVPEIQAKRKVVSTSICNANGQHIALVNSLQRTKGTRSNSLSDLSTSSRRTSPRKINSKLKTDYSCSEQSKTVSKATRGKTLKIKAYLRNSSKGTFPEKTEPSSTAVSSNNLNGNSMDQSRTDENSSKVYVLSEKERRVSRSVRKSTKKTILDSISEEKECDVKKTKRIPSECRLGKRSRNKIENSETVVKKHSEFNREKKKLRVSESVMEGSETTEREISKDDEQFPNECLNFKKKFSRQNVSEGLCDRNNDETKTDQRDDSGVFSERTEESDKNKNVFKHLAETGSDNVKGSENEDSQSDDSDDDLPEAFSPSSGPKKYFQPGDVVWAKHGKYPFWPAQVARKHPKRNAYYYISFLPKSKDRGLKIAKKNIKRFTEDHETYIRHKNQEIDMLLREQFEEAVKQADDILIGRVLQKNDNCQGEEGDQDFECSDGDSEPLSPSNVNVEQDKPDRPVSEIDEQEDCESGFDSSDVDSQQLAGNGRSPRQRKQVSRYSNILNELHWCKQRLLDIYRGKVPSSRHQTFKYGTVGEKNFLTRQTSFGPIQDDETCTEIIRLLKSWYDDETKTTSITFGYVYDVWLPEVMTHYIQLKDNLSRQEAERVYLDYAKHVDQKDVEEIKSSLKNQTIDADTMQRTVERAKRTLLNAN